LELEIKEKMKTWDTLKNTSLWHIKAFSV
jgi:hypothetical protein